MKRHVEFAESKFSGIRAGPFKKHTAVSQWSRAREHERRLGHSDRTVLLMPPAVSNLTFTHEGKSTGLLRC